MKLNDNTTKDFKEITKIDTKTGKYTNAQKVGRNVSIGLLVILTGVLYSLGGIYIVLTAFAAIISSLFVLSVIIYILVKIKKV